MSLNRVRLVRLTSCDVCSTFATYSVPESACVCDAGAQALKLVGNKMVECAPCSGATYKNDVGNGGCMPCMPFSRAVDGRSCACMEGYYSSSLLSTDQALLACDGNQACCVKCPVEGSCLDVKVGPLPGYWWAEQSAYNAGLLRANASARANATNTDTDTDTNPDTNTNTNTSSTSNTTTATRMGSGSGTLNLNLRIVHFFPCSPPEACTSTGCARGYTGFLCGECDAQAGYATDGSLQRCVSASGTNASLFAIVTLVGVAVTGYLFRASVRARSLVPLIILINYAQLATEADIGSDLYRFVTALQFNMFTIGAGQSLVTGSFSSIWLLDLFLPMALHGLAWGWYAAFKAQDYIRATYFPGVGPASLSPSRGPDRGHQLLLTHMSIFLFTFLGCTKTALQIFNCKQIDGRVVLAVHPGMTCWESTHNGLVTVSVIYLVIFVVCIPSLLAAVLLKPKWLPKRLAVLDMGFMKASYRAERYWWELVMLAVRVAYAVVVVSFSSSPFFRTCALLLLTFLVSSIHVWHRPYRSRVDNTLQTGALQVLHLCFIITLVWQQDVTQNTTGCSIALFVVNVFVFVCAMSLVMRVLVHRVTGKRVLELDDNENENENQSGPAKALGTGTGIGTGAGTGKALAGQDGDGDGDGDAFMQVAPATARTGKASILAQSIELQHPQPQHAPSAAITSTPSASARYVSPADSPAPLHPHPHPHPTSPSSFNTWHPSHRPAHSTLQHTQFEPLHSRDTSLNRPPGHGQTLPRPSHHHGMPSFSAAHISNSTVSGAAGASAAAAGVDAVSDSDSLSPNPLHDPSGWQEAGSDMI